MHKEQLIGNELAPGDSALFLLVGDTPVETVAEALNAHGGSLYHTNISDEASDVLEKASDHDVIADAINADD